jgi:hypothetical protein
MSAAKTIKSFPITPTVVVPVLSCFSIRNPHKKAAGVPIIIDFLRQIFKRLF